MKESTSKMFDDQILSLENQVEQAKV